MDMFCFFSKSQQTVLTLFKFWGKTDKQKFIHVLQNYKVKLLQWHSIFWGLPFPFIVFEMLWHLNSPPMVKSTDSSWFRKTHKGQSTDNIRVKLKPWHLKKWLQSSETGLYFLLEKIPKTAALKVPKIRVASITLKSNDVWNKQASSQLWLSEHPIDRDVTKKPTHLWR